MVRAGLLAWLAGSACYGSGRLGAPVNTSGVVDLEICGNGLDDDGNGAADCDDPVCDGLCPETCGDGRDNDGDLRVDCADPDCDGVCDEDCSDDRDNDGDGRVDCADADCLGMCPEACADGLDNDGDGATDCADGDCVGAAHCSESDCADGIDNERDGLIDCEDGECFDDPRCAEGVCTDGLDDDSDGLVDCEDPDCWGRGCAVSEAWVESAERIEHFDVRLQFYYACRRDAVYGYTHYRSARVIEPRGRVRVMTTGASDWQSCTWSARSATFRTGWFGSPRVTPLTRRDFHVQAGCGLNDDGFLPSHLGFGTSSLATARNDPLELGKSWYRGVPAHSGYYPRMSTYWLDTCWHSHSGTVFASTSASVIGGATHRIIE